MEHATKTLKEEKKSLLQNSQNQNSCFSPDEKQDSITTTSLKKLSCCDSSSNCCSSKTSTCTSKQVTSCKEDKLLSCCNTSGTTLIDISPDVAKFIENENKMFVKLEILGLNCADCATVAEKSLQSLQGVSEVKVSYITNSAVIFYEKDSIGEDTFVKEVEKLGHKASIIEVKHVNDMNKKQDKKELNLFCKASKTITKDLINRIQSEIIEGCSNVVPLNSKYLKISYNPDITGTRFILRVLNDILQKDEIEVVLTTKEEAIGIISENLQQKEVKQMKWRLIISFILSIFIAILVTSTFICSIEFDIFL